jgi:predicted dinucleotide-binding enzyme
MKIGIIGCDDRAVAIGRLLAGGGHEVTFSDSSRTERAEAAASQVNGASVEIPYRQAMTREILVFATPRAEIDRALTSLGSDTGGMVIVDAVDGKPEG